MSRRLARWRMAAVVALAWALAAAPAQATSVSRERLADLAAAAAGGDDAALAELRAVDRVGGQAVDVRRLLAGADGEDLDRRLQALSAPSGASPGAQAEPADQARQQAEDVLNGKDFKPRQPPRPLRGVLNWLGDRVAPVTDALGDFFSWLAEEQARLLPVALLVALAAFVIAVRFARQRSPLASAGDRRSFGGTVADDPADLEAAAERAEAAGDLSAAVRLRFRAGLLRLDRAGRLPFRPSLTTGVVRQALPSPDMDRLSANFDEIAYGGRPASPADVASAREDWARVLAGAANSGGSPHTPA